MSAHVVRPLTWITACIISATLFYGSAVGGQQLMVYAAASLATVIEEVATTLEFEPGNDVVFNLEASSGLARQIIAGAPADIFISADEIKMNWLEEQGLILPGSRRSLLSNTLVIIGRRNHGFSISNPGDLTSRSITRIGLADPAAVPAGMYAKAWLEGEALWEYLTPRFIPLHNVRAVLAAVASGNVDLGFVYRTDLAHNDQVEIAFTIPPAKAPAISYPVAILNATANEDAARRFVDALFSEEARMIFEQYGFGVSEK